MSFRRYPKYKESGVEWLGQVPGHWSLIRYKNVFAEKDSVVGSTYPAGSISYGRVVFKDDEFLHEPTKASYQEVKAGEFLINPINLNYDLKSLRTALSDINTRVSPAYIVLKAKAESDLNYLKHQLHVFDLYHMKTLGAGVRQTITFGDIGGCFTVLPPLPEQAAIADFLDRETAKIDGLIAEQERLIELLTEEIKAQALVSFSSPKCGHVRLGEVVDVISRPVVQKPGEEYTRLGLFNRGRGLFHKDASETDDMGDSDFFWIQEGDLIISGQFAWEGAVALASDTENGCVVSHRYPVLRGKAGVLLTEHLFALLMTRHGDFLLNEHSRGAAGRNRPLNIKSLLKEKIPLPTLEEQQIVACAVHLKKELMPLVSTQIELLQERRSALISAAVTGQIDVRGLHHQQAA
jgi:type I restriction enzyme S subunit